MHTGLRVIRTSFLFLGVIYSALSAHQVMAQDADAEVMLDEIVVTGTRASLISALNAKRAADSIMDGITAEELGVFPDANVADSLSHITGVTISRASGGEGQMVNIRGLGPQFSIVTVNDRILATDQNGREFAFDVLPSQVISEAWVHKSVSASTLEGSIGGAINLKTARPFDNPGRQLAFSAEGQYGEKSEEYGHEFALVGSNTFADDTMGVLFSALLSNTPTRTDSLSDLNYGEHNWGYDHNNSLTNPADFWLNDSRDLIIPAVVAYRARVEDKKRTAFSGVFQFAPNDKLEIVADALFTRLDAPAVGYTESFYMNANTSSFRDGFFTGVPSDVYAGDVSNVDSFPEGSVLTGVTMDNLVPELVTFTEHRVVDTYQFGLNGTFQATDDLVLIGDVYTSKSTRDAAGKDKFVVAKPNDAATPNTAIFSINRGQLPNVTFDFDPSTGISSFSDLTEDSDFGPHWAESNGVDIEDQVVGASLIGELNLDFSIVSSLEFGVVYNERTKTRTKFDNDGFEGLYSEAPFLFSDTGVNVVNGFGLSDFLGGIGGDFPREFVGFDIDAYYEALRAADNNPDILVYDDDGDDATPLVSYPEGYSDGFIPSFNPNESFEVAEETLSFFIQANLNGEIAGMPWFGNIGLRHSTTDTASNGWDQEIISVDQAPNDDWTWIINYADPEAVTYNQNYSKLLPSFNFGLELSDELLLRLSYAEVMSRASINQLSTEVDNSGLTYQANTINKVGNPGLLPVEAQQADIGLEWYFREGSALTGAVFWKDISGLVQDWQPVYGPDEQDLRPTLQIENFTSPWLDNGYEAVPINVFEPQNLDRATALGYEIGLQHWFANGFGLTANYTAIDTESYTDDFLEGVLAGVAETSYSLYLYYGTGDLNMQIGASHTEEYITSHWSPLNVIGDRTYKSTADPMTWMSASASYQVTDNLQVYAEADNILNENWKGYIGEGIINAYEEWGRKLNLGVRYKF